MKTVFTHTFTFQPWYLITPRWRWFIYLDPRHAKCQKSYPSRIIYFHILPKVCFIIIIYFHKLSIFIATLQIMHGTRIIQLHLVCSYVLAPSRILSLASSRRENLSTASCCTFVSRCVNYLISKSWQNSVIKVQIKSLQHLHLYIMCVK